VFARALTGGGGCGGGRGGAGGLLAALLVQRGAQFGAQLEVISRKPGAYTRPLLGSTKALFVG